MVPVHTAGAAEAAAEEAGADAAADPDAAVELAAAELAGETAAAEDVTGVDAAAEDAAGVLLELDELELHEASATAATTDNTAIPEALRFMVDPSQDVVAGVDG